MSKILAVYSFKNALKLGILKIYFCGTDFDIALAHKLETML